MTAIALNGADYLPSDKGESIKKTGGEVMNRLEWVYYDSGNSKYKLASNNSAAESAVAGITTSPCAADGSPVEILGDGATFEMANAAFTTGKWYEISDVAGDFQLANSNVSGEFSGLCGVALSTTKFQIKLAASGVDIA